MEGTTKVTYAISRYPACVQLDSLLHAFILASLSPGWLQWSSVYILLNITGSFL